MKIENDSDYEFNIIVQKKGDMYSLHAPQWGIAVENAELSSAYQELQNQQKAIIDEYTKAGLEHELPQREKEPAFAKWLSSTGISNIFAAIIISISLIFITFIVFEKIENYEKKIAKKVDEINSPSPNAVGKIILGVVEKTAQAMEEMPPERRERIQENLRIILNEIQNIKKEVGLEKMNNDVLSYR